MTGANPKFRVFQGLKRNLLNADLSNCSINHVIESWASNRNLIIGKGGEGISNEEVISRHRGIFKSKDSNTPTSSQLFLRSLRTEYGTFTLQTQPESDALNASPQTKI